MAPRVERLVDTFILMAAAAQLLARSHGDVSGAYVRSDNVRARLRALGFQASTFNQALATRIGPPLVDKHPPHRGPRRQRTEAYAITVDGVNALAVRAMHAGNLGRNLMYLELRALELVERLGQQELQRLRKELQRARGGRARH